MIRWLLFLAIVVASQIPDYQPPPHGPYYGKNVVCYRGDTQLDAKPKGRVHCDCRAPCDEDGARTGEDPKCQTYCGIGEQCVCHADECPHD